MRIYWGTKLVFETEPYVCYGSFYSGADYCCKAMKTFVIRKVDLTGATPYYIRIDYRHKNSPPCIRMFCSSNTITPMMDLSNISHSMTELSASPFYIQPIINLNIAAIS